MTQTKQAGNKTQELRRLQDRHAEQTAARAKAAAIVAELTEKLDAGTIGPDQVTGAEARVRVLDESLARVAKLIAGIEGELEAKRQVKARADQIDGVRRRGLAVLTALKEMRRRYETLDASVKAELAAVGKARRVLAEAYAAFNVEANELMPRLFKNTRSTQDHSRSAIVPDELDPVLEDLRRFASFRSFELQWSPSADAVAVEAYLLLHQSELVPPVSPPVKAALEMAVQEVERERRERGGR